MLTLLSLEFTVHRRNDSNFVSTTVDIAHKTIKLNHLLSVSLIFNHTETGDQTFY